ncbi:MAG: argininosuccinate lyase [Bacteroidales bacterium]|nr:argininosuccinate lyase [Bacteroidales bacterium]
MRMKLWDKGVEVNKNIETFTVGRDREMDLFLAPYDIMGTLAHIRMLESVGLLAADERVRLTQALQEMYHQAVSGEFRIEEDIEDVHSQVELMLTRRLGDIGKKVHSGRSRNDQVLVDIKLYLRAEIEDMVHLTEALFGRFRDASEQYKAVLMPGYTHLQVAMPSSFGLWFGAYAESLTDDMHVLQAAWRVTNQNPLGSAAGYGSSFPLDRTMTTRLLGFDDLNYNVVYAQMGRGKTEKIVAFAMASLAATLSRFAMDACLYMSQNFGFIVLPENLTTGSSIMPHKKNPDVFELIRGKCNRIQTIVSDITLMLTNLPSGYFRDMQLLKEILFPAFGDLKSCLHILISTVPEIKINTHILDDARYDCMFSVEAVNRLVLEGVPFRDAYRRVAQDIREGRFVPDKHLSHTHEGSIGRLCNEEIARKMEAAVRAFGFDKVHEAVAALVGA